MIRMGFRLTTIANDSGLMAKAARDAGRRRLEGSRRIPVTPARLEHIGVVGEPDAQHPGGSWGRVDRGEGGREQE
jgi:hypothetical protein